MILVREAFLLFLVPISPPVRFDGVESHNFFLDGRYLNSIFLDERFCEYHSCTADPRTQSHGAVVPGVYTLMCCARVYILSDRTRPFIWAIMS